MLSLAAILIAGATPVRAQTLPLYDVNGRWVKCLAGMEGAEARKSKKMAEIIGLYCNALRNGEWFVRDHLAKEWDSFSSGKRQLCINDRNITTYNALAHCLDDPHFIHARRP
jgi:hypothetical protein